MNGEDLVVRPDRPASPWRVVLWKSSPGGLEQLRADEHGEQTAQEKATRTETRYITPIRLWSSVKIQEEMPRLCVR